MDWTGLKLLLEGIEPGPLQTPLQAPENARNPHECWVLR
jgi:hypothetical protein